MAKSRTSRYLIKQRSSGLTTREKHQQIRLLCRYHTMRKFLTAVRGIAMLSRVLRNNWLICDFINEAGVQHYTSTRGACRIMRPIDMVLRHVPDRALLTYNPSTTGETYV